MTQSQPATAIEGSRVTSDGPPVGTAPVFRQLEFVLGNKVMVGTVNANREYFESGVRDMAAAVLEYGDWLSRLLTHPVNGLDNYAELFELLTNGKDVIKAYCQVATEAGAASGS